MDFSITEIISILFGGGGFITAIAQIFVQKKKDKTSDLKERFEYWEKKFDEYGCLMKTCKDRIQ